MNIDHLYGSVAVWILVWLTLYFAYLLFWAVRDGRASQTMAAFCVADRSLPTWVAVTATTVAALTGWLFVALPGFILRDGFPAGYLGFAAIGIPAVGAFLAKRQWILSQKYGFLTAGEMFSAYFGGNVVRVFAVIVAVFFSVPLLAVLLDAAAQITYIASNRILDPLVMLWVLAAIIAIVTTLGGLHGIARSGPLQMTLIVVGVSLTAIAAYHFVGGFAGLKSGLAEVARSNHVLWGTTRQYGGGDYNSYFALSGVVQWTFGIGRDMAQGSPWTSAFALTFVVSLVGVQTSPIMTTFAFASRHPNANAPQQVWATAGVVGFLLLVCAPLIGTGGLLLGAAGPIAGVIQPPLLPDISANQHGLVTAVLIQAIGGASPWLGGFLATCLLIAFTACAGAYVISGATSIARDLFVAYFKPKASDHIQKAFTRVVILILLAAATVMATFFHAGMVTNGSAALTLAVQLLPAYLAVTWIPWFTRQGVQAGLIVGTIVGIFADPLGQAIATHNLPWGVAPWTIHAAAWGLAANFAVCLLGSAVSQSDDCRKHRQAFHALFIQHNGHRISRRAAAMAWVVTMIWTFLALGPGATVGNYLFGEPSVSMSWTLDIPSIWGWQLIWWCVGVLLVWFLAYGLKLSFNGRPDATVNTAASFAASDHRTP